MSLRQKITLVVGVAIMAACSAPTAPQSCADITTMGSSRCATR